MLHFSFSGNENKLRFTVGNFRNFLVYSNRLAAVVEMYFSYILGTEKSRYSRQLNYLITTNSYITFLSNTAQKLRKMHCNSRDNFIAILIMN
jgi:hypothetical protein